MFWTNLNIATYAPNKYYFLFCYFKLVFLLSKLYPFLENVSGILLISTQNVNIYLGLIKPCDLSSL